mmetsp:Transcript_39599/g.51892  ORF Transcript_39599/g.51892 Transcript_39599/m.51892 type:complete len:93 (+) Transcript_39599:368-646(+)
MTRDLPNWLFAFERRLEHQQRKGSKWISSHDRPSIADFSLGGFLCSVHANEASTNFYTYSLVLSRLPNVNRYVQLFRDEMADYLEKRPVRPN